MDEVGIRGFRTDCATFPIQGNRFCSWVSERISRRIGQIAQVRNYSADHSFSNHGDGQRPVSVLKTGFLRLLRYSIDGQRQIISIVAPGELSGMAIENRDGYEFETVTPVSLCQINRGAFERLMGEEPELRRAVCRQYSERLEAVRQNTWSIGMLSTEERLRGFLVQATRIMPYQPLPDGGGVLTLTIPRADIADLLGTTKATISRLSHRLARDGLVEIRSPRHFLIPNLDLLARISALSVPVLERTKRASPKPQKCPDRALAAGNNAPTSSQELMSRNGTLFLR